MKKTLHTDAIANDLKGASLFFRRSDPDHRSQPAASEERGSPASQHPIQKASPSSPPASADAMTRMTRTTRTTRSERTSRPAVRPVRPVRRFMVRHAFEIYQDQVESLRGLALEERMAGGVGSMSHLVRTALDQVIAGKRRDGG